MAKLDNREPIFFLKDGRVFYFSSSWPRFLDDEARAGVDAYSLPDHSTSMRVSVDRDMKVTQIDYFKPFDVQHINTYTTEEMYGIIESNRDFYKRDRVLETLLLWL